MNEQITESILAARKVLPIYEAYEGATDAPRKALEAAELALANPSEENKRSARAAAYAADAAAYAAAYAADAAAYAAARAADAAAYAADADADAADDAAYAARKAAAYAARKAAACSAAMPHR